MATNIFIAYISPNGSTGKVAAAFADGFDTGGASVTMLDLANPGDVPAFTGQIATGGEVLLLVGSPVYRDMAVPPVMAFIEQLPANNGHWAVPFVTYGRACSGVALWQMAAAMQKKGFKIAGAAKVVALHSMMWAAESPAGQGHPDSDDLDQVRLFADKLGVRYHADQPVPLPLSVLDYQSEERAAEFKAKIDQPWTIIPKTVDAKACTECGTCADVCPVGAIELNPLPVFDGTCFDCFNCIRLCPETAIDSAVPLEKIEAMIRDRVRTINEQPVTEVFLPKV